MTTTTCWREHKNSFLGAVLGSELSVTLLLSPFNRGDEIGRLSPPMPAGPNPLRTRTRSLSQGTDGRPRPVLWTPTALLEGLEKRPSGSTGRRPGPLTGAQPATKSPLRGCRPPPPDWRAFCMGFISVKPLDCVSPSGV